MAQKREIIPDIDSHEIKTTKSEVNTRISDNIDFPLPDVKYLTIDDVPLDLGQALRKIGLADALNKGLVEQYRCDSISSQSCLKEPMTEENTTIFTKSNFELADLEDFIDTLSDQDEFDADDGDYEQGFDEMIKIQPDILRRQGYTSFTNFQQGEYKKLLSEARQRLCNLPPQIKYIPKRVGDKFVYSAFNLRYIGLNTKDDFIRFIKVLFRRFGFLIVSETLFYMKLNFHEYKFMSRLLLLDEQCRVCTSKRMCRPDRIQLSRLIHRFKLEVEKANSQDSETLIRDYKGRVDNSRADRGELLKSSIMKEIREPRELSEKVVIIPLTTHPMNHNCVSITFSNGRGKQFFFKQAHNITEIRIVSKFGCNEDGHFLI